MTRQLPKPVAVPLGWVIFGAINGFIYGGGWLHLAWTGYLSGQSAPLGCSHNRPRRC